VELKIWLGFRKEMEVGLLTSIKKGVRKSKSFATKT